MPGNSMLYAIARNITESMKPKDSPTIGDIWIHEGREVEITSGYYLDPEYGRLSNCWGFVYLDTKEKGSAYDNDRQKFHPKGVGNGLAQ